MTKLYNYYLLAEVDNALDIFGFDFASFGESVLCRPPDEPLPLLFDELLEVPVALLISFFR